MASATIIKVWQTPERVHIAARVAEGGQQGNVEYVASVANDADFAALSNAEKKAALTAAIKAKRDEQQAGPQAVSGISGAVTV